MKANLSVTTSLPSTFRHRDFLAFHQRDKTELAEKVDGNLLRKGMLIDGIPCCLSLALNDNNARLELDADAVTSPLDNASLTALLAHMLGLDQDIDTFESQYHSHPDISRLLAHHSGLRIPQTVTPFEAITWAITGQLISVEAAVSIRRRLIETTGKPHSSGIWCSPDASMLASTDIETYRGCGYSNSKATTIQRVAQMLVNDELDLSLSADPFAVSRDLLAIKGVGPWTVSYTLLRGFSYLDGSLHGDVAVRRNLQRLLGCDEKPSEKETQAWLKSFSPWRALVAAHLWAMQSEQGY
ncbi:DNA-3-methyladenine glycosylase family protein [Enterovibrio calviensis]|uniref:DNA-3-methyladenine glycosylase family protein n=1 Tax=Enterovibrio calviensis TaxID=91359 RepID=UPI00048467FE|nr:AlkA N-terminal domain-containing protein [Enterovibrio calviensis]